MIISILGSTGSIGKSALDVVRQHPDKFSVYGLSAGSNTRELAEQAKEFKPKIVHISDSGKIEELKEFLGGIEVGLAGGIEEINKTFDDPSVERIVMAISGVAALKPLIRAIELKKDIALANKESIVATGRLIPELAKKNGVKILPVDSEHSAIWQCLEGSNGNKFKRILLTASGGAFRNKSLAELEKVTPAEAVYHPRWKMGKKITVDSGTLMNKGLEVIEAMNLFGASLDQIEVLIHPQSIIHSAVEFTDGSVIAQLGVTDMRIPIQYALTYPGRISNNLPRLNFVELGQLTFEKPHFDNFPCLNLAFKAAKAGGSAPCVLNAANEVAVAEFLAGKIRFTDIPRVVENALNNEKVQPHPNINDIFAIDRSTRDHSLEFIGGISRNGES